MVLALKQDACFKAARAAMKAAARTAGIFPALTHFKTLIAVKAARAAVKAAA
jgi:hypothetical protein